MTLVEIIVVTAIISILSVLLFPSIKNGINSANRAKCLSNLRQIGIAAEQYSQDHGNIFPHIDFWPNEIAPYLLNKNSASFPKGTRTILWCPSALPSDLVASGYNQNIAYAINASGYAGLGIFKETSVNGLRIVPSQRIAFMDGKSANMWDTTPERVPAWHVGSYNVIFADAHAESVLRRDFLPGSTAWNNLLWGYVRY